MHDRERDDSSLEDARRKLRDLSDAVVPPSENGNPFEALLRACNDDPSQIQALYSAHRAGRSAQQGENFLSSAFTSLVIDQYLLRLERPEVEPGFVDPRNGIVFWARPPEHVVRLAARLQSRLKMVAPHIWLMPFHRLHMTTLEIIHSRTPHDTAAVLAALRPSVSLMTNFTHSHRARLVRPMISYDLSAVAISFVPAAGDPKVSPPPEIPSPPCDNGSPEGAITEEDSYTYHHLRRDMFSLGCTHVDIQARYQVPSAHITLGRFLMQDDHETPEARKAWVREIDDINQWLAREVWGRTDGEFVGEWIVGQEKGLDCRTGALWYGGGRTVMAGEGF